MLISILKNRIFTGYKMAQALQNLTIASPGFGGLNTADSPLLVPNTFASEANNVVIDTRGRIAARKGHAMVSSNGGSVLGSSDGIEHVSEFVQRNNTKIVFSGGNNKVFTGTSTLSDATPGGYTISANNWSACSIADKHLLFQRAHEPLVYDASTSALTKMTAHGSSSGTPPQAHICLAAFGRVWAADVSGNNYTLYWSDLLDPVDWNSGSSGSLDLSTVWPNGNDQITALANHNDFLVIFGKNSILIYSGAGTPASMTLVDTIANIGCVARDAVVNTGSNLIYVDESGVRSLGRTIQEKSSPIGDISRNVNLDIKAAIASDGTNIKMVYDPNHSFIICSFPTLNNIYVFDTLLPLQDGSYRTTTWSSIEPLAFWLTNSNDLYFGVKTGLARYFGQQDNGQKYIMSYFSHPLDFGDSSRLKMLKRLNLVTFMGSNARVTMQYAYDYRSNFRKQAFDLPTINAGQYNISEFNTSAEYSDSPVLINRKSIAAGGSGAVVQIGLESQVDGKEIAIQQIDVQSLVGRMV